jgi:hypothetical protein
MKSIETRISESLEMRKNIQKLGVLVIDEIREELKDIFNNYVKHGDICNKKININADISIIITLNSAIGSENGIVLER